MSVVWPDEIIELNKFTGKTKFPFISAINCDEKEM